MADKSIVGRYLNALATADGKLARSLFVEDGVLDDYRGGHRAGGAVIERFIDARPPRTIELLSDVIAEGHRLTVYAQLDYTDGRSALVRFIFTAPDELIVHLCNSRIEFVPTERLRADKRHAAAEAANAS